MLPLVALLGATALGAQQAFDSPYNLRTPLMEPKQGEEVPFYKDWRFLGGAALLVGGAYVGGDAGQVMQFAGLGLETSVVSTELARKAALKAQQQHAATYYQQQLPPGYAQQGGYPQQLMAPQGVPGAQPSFYIQSPVAP